MNRAINFSAGPATLPESVLQQAQQEMLDWRGSGMSVMEMSHRGKEFMGIHAQAQSDLRELLKLPTNYKILFTQGGAIAQNAIVPMNLLRGRSSVSYVNTGEWSKRSIAEAARYARVLMAASAEDSGYTMVPAQESWQIDPGSAYLHICSNETINGVEYHWTPDLGDLPLVADMSSNILSRPLDVSRYGLIYAGAQKNMGVAGLTLVIVREDLLDRALPITPSVFEFRQQVQQDSMLNTPPTYSIYMAGLVFQWIKAMGGLSAMESRNRAKAALLYDYIDASGFYRNSVRQSDRSLMNVPFHLPDAEQNEAFLQGAAARSMLQLKGHRLVGGMRASIYNAMPEQGVLTLIDYMKEFAAQHG